MVKLELNSQKDFINSLKNHLSENNIINESISYILDFQNHILFTSIIALIIFIYSLYTGAYYYIYKSLSTIISIHFTNNDIIQFIIKIIIFYYLFNLILKTLLGLIFINKEDEKYSCVIKDIIDKYVDKISFVFFAIYNFILIPSYIINNIPDYYKTLIENLKPFLINLEWKNNSLKSLNESEKKIERLKELLNDKIIEFYDILNSYNGTIHNYFKTIVSKIFIEKDNKHNEDTINITACSYSMDIVLYAIFLLIIYLLLFIAFPETTTIRIILFIILLLFLIYSLIRSISFNIAIKNFNFIKAINAMAIKNMDNNLVNELQNTSQGFLTDLKNGINPLFNLLGLFNNKNITEDVLNEIRNLNNES